MLSPSASARLCVRVHLCCASECVLVGVMCVFVHAGVCASPAIFAVPHLTATCTQYVWRRKLHVDLLLFLVAHQLLDEMLS